MSLIPPGLSRLLQFYLSGPLPCPYLPGQVERKLFTRLTGISEIDEEINATLTRAGFRRSHDVVYRPACHECNACLPVRVPVVSFTPSKTQRRIARINRTLTLEITPAVFQDELFELFRAYQNHRHPDSDMAHMSASDFAQMLNEGATNTYIYALRHPDGALMAAMIADRVQDGISAVYSFFTPEARARSLGSQMILTLIEAMRSQNLPYVYLGYWIADARKMSYKSHFRPLQALGPQGWDWVTSA